MTTTRVMWAWAAAMLLACGPQSDADPLRSTQTLRAFLLYRALLAGLFLYIGFAATQSRMETKAVEEVPA